MGGSRITRAAEYGYVVLILAIAFVVWWSASALPPAPYDALGPKTFPIWVSYALAALGLTMLLRLLLGHALGRAAQSMVLGFDGATEHMTRPGIAVATFLLSLVYAALLSIKVIGFLIGTALYLFFAGLILGPLERRRAGIMAIFAVVAAVILDLAFRRLFKLDLP